MKKILCIFILSYGVAFYFVNKSYWKLENPDQFIKSQTQPNKRIDARHEQQLDAKYYTVFLNEEGLSNSYLQLNKDISNEDLVNKKKAEASGNVSTF